MKIIKVISIVLILFAVSCNDSGKTGLTPRLVVSENKRFLATEAGKPFFWLGDTGWLLFSRLTREEAEKYLEDRRQKGFNVIQAVVLHDITREVNAYGDSALSDGRIDMPKVTPGSSSSDPEQYDYWDHMDYIIDLAGSKGIYMALVVVWGSNIKSGHVTAEQAENYASWIAERYKNRSNVIWINGGDIRGSDSTAIWNKIGTTIRQHSPGQLITFHPFGRTQSSRWFHDQQWLDFNMFQSGHRRYDQDTSGVAYGEDNWKYVNDDYSKKPVRPTLDGEPSYEEIPQGLHDISQPRWTDNDVRRYAYWSVFAGACGFTYGHNSVMQFYRTSDKVPAYGAITPWEKALNAPGASQVGYLKLLMLSRPYFERVPAPDLVDDQGEKYNYLAATRGKNYAFIYTYTGRTIKINRGKIAGKTVKASWYDPRTGKYSGIADYRATEIPEFDPPGREENCNDWVLVLDFK